MSLEELNDLIYEQSWGPVATEWFVKVLAPGRKRWQFLTPKGGLIGLRIHASRYKDRGHAERQAKFIEENNAGYRAKVVEA